MRTRPPIPRPPYPTVRCIGWHSNTGADMPCAKGGIVREGEPGGREEWGQCSLCLALDCKASKIVYQRGVRRVQRVLATPSPVPESVDWDALTRGE